MGWSNGTYTKVHDWTDDEAAGENIESVRFDQQDDDFAAGIHNCLTKDGQNTPTANLPMLTKRHTNVGNAAALTDYASATDVIYQNLTYYTDSGAADAYVITPSPAITGYIEGQKFTFRAANANTTASTLDVNGQGVKAIETNDGEALGVGAIIVGGYYEVIYDANGSRFVMLSPDSATPASGTVDVIAGAGMTGGGPISSNVTLNVIAGDGIDVAADSVALASSTAGDGLTFTSGVLALDATVGGAGLTHTTGVLAVGAGDGITVAADAIALAATTAGNGLTHTTGVLAVVGTDGLTAAADAIGLTDVAATTTNPVDIASGVVSLDVEALTTIEGNLLAATDTFYVENGGVSKGVEVQAMGLQTQTSQTTQTLAAADMNTIMQFDAAANPDVLTLPKNTTTDLPLGVPVVLNVKHATQTLTVTAAADVTLVSVYNPGGGVAASDTVNAGGTALLFKTATDVWCLSGDISD